MPLIPFHLAEENVDLHPIRLNTAPTTATPAMLIEAAALPFRLNRTKCIRKINRLNELDLDELRHRYGFQAMLLNIFGPVLGDYTSQPDPALISKLREIHQKLLLCLIPENNRPLPKAISALGIPVAHGFSPQSDSRCYTAISSIFIQTRHHKTCSLTPEQHLVVGSNFLTDTICRDAGMKYLHVRPRPGIESGFYRFLRKYGEKVANIHQIIRQWKIDRHLPDEDLSAPPALTMGAHENGRSLKNQL